MEIGNQVINYLKFKARRDKNLSPARICSNLTIKFSGDGLQGADTGSSYSKNLAAARLNSLDGISRFLTQLIVLGMHFMIFNAIS